MCLHVCTFRYVFNNMPYRFISLKLFPLTGSVLGSGIERWILNHRPAVLAELADAPLCLRPACGFGDVCRAAGLCCIPPAPC